MLLDNCWPVAYLCSLPSPFSFPVPHHSPVSLAQNLLCKFGQGETVTDDWRIGEVEGLGYFPLFLFSCEVLDCDCFSPMKSPVPPPQTDPASVVPAPWKSPSFVLAPSHWPQPLCSDKTSFSCHPFSPRAALLAVANLQLPYHPVFGFSAFPFPVEPISFIWFEKPRLAFAFLTKP